MKGIVVTPGFTFSFDYRNGSHCGAGAPRFNVVSRDPVTNVDTFHFVGGCSNGTPTPAPQDPLQWTRVTIDVTSASQAFAAIPAGNKLRSVDLIFDEGTDTVVLGDAEGIGLAIVDNITIGNKVITDGDNDDDDHDRD